MKYINKTFSVPLGSKQYRDNFDKTFKKRAVKKSHEEKKKDQSNGEEVPSKTN